jgi:hypothetical protein
VQNLFEPKFNLAKDFGDANMPVSIKDCVMQRHFGKYVRNADNVGCDFCLARGLARRLKAVVKL